MSNLVKFTVPAGHKLSECAAPESIRYAMGGIALFASADGTQAYLTATDGKALAALPVEVEGMDKPILLPSKAISANGKESKIEVNGEVRRTCGRKTDVFQMPPQVGRFPAIRSVFPKVEDVAEYTVLYLDANSLKQVADAISTDGKLTLFIPPAQKSGTTTQVCKPLVVVGHTDEMDKPSGIGLVMPLTGSPGDISRDRKHYATHSANMRNDLKFD